MSLEALGSEWRIERPELDISGLGEPYCLVGCRRIAEGDELQLTATERASLGATLTASRRASGAARALARQLVSQLGAGVAPIVKGRDGAPVWPHGIAGSLAHDATFAVAAVGWKRDVGSVGIDIEPAEPLPSDVVPLVATPRELARCADPMAAREIFCAKEAVYKAVYALDGRMLDYDDIGVDLQASIATTRQGHRIALRRHVSTHVVLLALIRS
jgi:4'-phosphopantetheinyl transferase EntD